MSCHIFYINNLSYTLIICSHYLFWFLSSFFLSFLTIFYHFFVLWFCVISRHVKMGKKKMQKWLGNSFSPHQIGPVCKISCFYPKSPRILLFGYLIPALLKAEALRAFEKWKAELSSGRKKECTPETGLGLGARPGEVFCFGEPCWSREDFNK